MNSFLCTSTALVVDKIEAHTDVHTDTLFIDNENENERVGETDDTYATMPMAAVNALPPQEPLDEEELYTSFEEAISDRLLTISDRLSRISGPLSHTYHAQDSATPTTQQRTMSAIMPANHAAVNTSISAAMKRPFQAWQNMQRGVLYGSLGLMFILLGFDTMGLLVLHIH